MPADKNQAKSNTPAKDAKAKPVDPKSTAKATSSSKEPALTFEQ